jgi:pyruvate formate lyase activating enzyme
VSGALEPLGLVARILPMSAVDGPGNRAVIFLQGCDFDCRYCHNPETRKACSSCGLCLSVCPEHALSRGEDGKIRWESERCVDCGSCIAACPSCSSPKTRLMSAAEILGSLGRYRPFLRGITVSGGECGLQTPFLESLLRASRAASLPGLVDTNGSTDYLSYPGLLEAAEGFMLDVKAWNEEEHRTLVGEGNRAVLANLRALARIDALAEVRTVVVPLLFDAEETVREVSRVLSASRSHARYKIIRYRPQGVRPQYRDLPVPDEATTTALAAIARSAGVAEVLVV